MPGSALSMGIAQPELELLAAGCDRVRPPSLLRGRVPQLMADCHPPPDSPKAIDIRKDVAHMGCAHPDVVRERGLTLCEHRQAA
jgi:hypothetical protein